MKKYLFIVLLLGVGFGQIVPDTLIMKTGKTFLGYYYNKDETFTHFKHQKSTEKDRIRNSVIQEIRLGDGTEVKKPISVEELPNVSNHLNSAGVHLENHVKYITYGTLLSPIGATLISASLIQEETPILGILVTAIGGYFSYEGFVSISKAGKELKKASKPMKKIEEQLKEND